MSWKMKRGRITIPYQICQRIGFRYNDILSFIQQDDGSVLVRREKICDGCKELAEDTKKMSPSKIFSTACQRKNREMHLCTFLRCGGEKSEFLDLIITFWCAILLIDKS